MNSWRMRFIFPLLFTLPLQCTAEETHDVPPDSVELNLTCKLAPHDFFALVKSENLIDTTAAFRKNSENFFLPQKSKRLTVQQMRVVYVFGFTDDATLFDMHVGTFNRDHYGVIVAENSQNKVIGRLYDIGSSASTRHIGPRMTEIFCQNDGRF